jgi:D-apionolactonase
MASLSIPALRCGGPGYLPQSHSLRAGPFSMLFEQGELRRIRLGDREVIRRIYLTVRGPDWSTVPAEITELKVDQSPESFVINYIARHRQGDVDFTWSVSFRGNADGEIRMEAVGTANSAFATNRVGVCVLHPLRECTGMPALVRREDDSVLEGRFPQAIEPHQPFLGFTEIAHVVEKEWLALVRLEGETFEMEDQRNWTDGSFKTYCPPQARPKPRKLETGWKTLQIASVMLQSPEGKPISHLAAALAAAESAKRAASKSVAASNGEEALAPPLPTLRPNTDKGFPLPGFGFGMASHGQALDAEDALRLKALAPFHLRVDLRLSHPGYRGDLAAAAAQARALSLPLEVALVLPENAEAALAEFAPAWEAAGAEAVRWLIFSENADATTDAAMAAARTRLGPFDPVASFARGSKGDFVLLNRNRPAPQPGISLVYGMCPQVHLTDNRTLVESLEGQAWTVATIAAHYPRANAIASPITLKRSPFSLALKKPAAADSAAQAEPAWRNQVDTRQFSLFGAGWTLGSLKRLALASANSATFYETTGLLGVMAGRGLAGDLLRSPAFDFPIEPGWVYPMYHVFADFAGFVGGHAYEVHSDQALRFDAVLLHAGEKASLLIANLEEIPGTVRLVELGNIGGMRRLHEGNAMRAMQDPEGYRNEAFEPCPGDQEGWEIRMRPFEYIRIDLSAA